MKPIFASVLGSAERTFEGETYNRVTAMSGTTIVKFKSSKEPEIGAVALIDTYEVGDVLWDDTKAERAFNVLQMYTNVDAITSAKEVAKTLEGLTL